MNRYSTYIIFYSKVTFFLILGKQLFLKWIKLTCSQFEIMAIGATWNVYERLRLAIHHTKIISLSQDTRIMYSTYHINHNISHLSYSDSTDSKLCYWHPRQVRNRMDLEKFYQWLAQKLVCFSRPVLDRIWNQNEIISIKRKTKMSVFVLHQGIQVENQTTKRGTR